MPEEIKLPEGYGAAAPYAKESTPSKGAAIIVKKGEKYIVFLSRCRKAGKDIKECATIWKKGSNTPNKTETTRRRAARILRKKKRVVA